MRKISKLLLSTAFILLIASFSTSCNDDDPEYLPIPRKLVTKITDGNTEYTFEYDDWNFLTKYTKTEGSSTETNTLSYDAEYRVTKRVNTIGTTSNTYEYTYNDDKIYEKDAASGIAVDTVIINKYNLPVYSSMYFANPDEEIQNVKYEFQQNGSYNNLYKKTDYKYKLEGGIKKEYFTTTRYKTGAYGGIYSFFINVPFWFRIYRLPFSDLGLGNDTKKMEIEVLTKENGIETVPPINKTLEYDITYDNMGYPLKISWEDEGVTKKLEMEYKIILLQ